MSDVIRGSVNGTPVQTYRGMKAKHALIALDVALYDACKEGRMIVRDAHGFVIGLDGALEEGFELFVAETPE